MVLRPKVTSDTFSTGRKIWRTLRFLFCLLVADAGFAHFFGVIAPAMAGTPTVLSKVVSLLAMFSLGFGGLAQWCFLFDLDTVIHYDNRNVRRMGLNAWEMEIVYTVLMPLFLVPYAVTSVLERVVDTMPTLVNWTRKEIGLRRDPYWPQIRKARTVCTEARKLVRQCPASSARLLESARRIAEEAEADLGVIMNRAVTDRAAATLRVVAAHQAAYEVILDGTGEDAIPLPHLLRPNEIVEAQADLGLLRKTLSELPKESELRTTAVQLAQQVRKRLVHATTSEDTARVRKKLNMLRSDLIEIEAY